MFQILKKIVRSVWSQKQICKNCGKLICNNADDYYGDQVCNCSQDAIKDDRKK